MPTRVLAYIWLMSLVAMLPTGWGTDCQAANLFTVIDLGSLDAESVEAARALHPPLGLSLTEIDRAALPSVQGLQGSGVNIRPVTFQMQSRQNTNSGFVLGTVPGGGDLANPFNSLTFGYTKKQHDDTFGPFVSLTYQDPSSDPMHSGIIGFASLDASGNVLITNGQGQRLIDLNTGISTDLTTLLPQGTLKHDGFSSVIHHGTISADGTIFAQVVATNGRFPDGKDMHTLMLSPAVSTPEPTTLVSFGMIVICLAAARHRSRV
ncbi:hypothetical protein V5E97_14835 [Singulisphaera sp. Ch08]|uniref:PEP-CTERM protein-sorting domain-containing protein n=1 Tax=Singulisphaera sp. Ch08 TaxID=3120278 RepID=A0AAU7CQH7_9BACT